MVSVTCPNCGAALQTEEGKQQMFCTHCGVKVAISNDNEHIEKTIDVAAIERAKVDKEIELRRLEYEITKLKHDERNNIRDNIMKVIALIIGGAVILGIYYIMATWL